MGTPKAMGIETEYGIMIIGDDQPDLSRASDILIGTYRQFGKHAIPCASSYPAQAGNHQKSAELSFKRETQHSHGAIADESADLMLSNGARFYNDHAHPEYSTPECLSPRLLVAADKAGEQIIAACQDIINRSGKLSPDQCLLIYKNNCDYKNNSYGCHENYLLSTELFTDLVYRRTPRLFRCLLPFFITRIIFCGAGKVGAENGTAPVGFQLSQRADFFETLVGPQTTGQRPLFNTRDEPHADPSRFRRLHVIMGDANMAEYSTYLKVGTTQLVLQMLEDGFIQVDLKLNDPLRAIQIVSRDLTFMQSLQLEDRYPMTALQIQHIYLDLARQYLEQGDSSEEAWNVWYEWEYVLGMLPDQADRLATRLDWAIKLRVLDYYLRSQEGSWEQITAWQPIIEEPDLFSARSMADARGLSWQDYERQRELYFGLRRLDLEYHDIRYDATQGMIGLFYRLQQRSAIERLVTDEEIERMRTAPPSDTRAYIRGQCIERFASNLVSADWSCLRFSGPLDEPGQSDLLLLQDPFRGTEAELASAWSQLDRPADVIRRCTPSAKGVEIDE